MVALLDPPMSDKKASTLSVKLHMDVIESARVVAAINNESMTDLLSGILRPVLTKMEEEAVRKRGSELSKRKGSK
jgi:hypothetical protein